MDLPMRILHVINDMRVGGTENLLLRHLRVLKESYPWVTSQVCVLGKQDAAFGAYTTQIPEAEYLEFSGRYNNPIESLGCISRLRGCIRRFVPDIVHSYLWNSDVFVALALLGRRAAHVAHIVDRRANRHSGSPTHWLQCRVTSTLYKLAGTHFAAVSEACRQHVIYHYRIDPKRIVVAHNAIFPEEFKLARDRNAYCASTVRPLILGTLASFKEEKGNDYLMRAMKYLASDGVILKIAGDERHLRSKLDGLVSALGISDRVEFLGRVPSAVGVYEKIDVFVVPSVSAEGLPTTILEAMAAGLPLVVTDIGGATEAVRNDEEAIVIPPRDVMALVSAIRFLIRHPEAGQRLGGNAMKRVADLFDVRKMTRSIVNEVYMASGRHYGNSVSGVGK